MSSEKRFVYPLIIGCAAAILIFHLVFWPEVKTLWGISVLYALLHCGLLASFVLYSIGAIRHKDDPNKDKLRWFVLLIASALCIWIGAWSSQYRADKSDNIEIRKR